MGYDTSFSGYFEVTPPLKPEHAAYLKKFNQTRRMQWEPSAKDRPPDPDMVDWLRRRARKF